MLGFQKFLHFLISHVSELPEQHCVADVSRSPIIKSSSDASDCFVESFRLSEDSYFCKNSTSRYLEINMDSGKTYGYSVKTDALQVTNEEIVLSKVAEDFCLLWSLIAVENKN